MIFNGFDKPWRSVFAASRNLYENRSAMFHRLDYVVKNAAFINGKDWAETVRPDALTMKRSFPLEPPGKV